MVKIALQIKANLENIVMLEPSGKDFRWCLKFLCSNCSTISDKWNYVSLSDEITAQHGRDIYNFTSKCKFCSRFNTATIIPDSIQSLTSDDENKYKTVVIFDCRGIEPCEFSPRDGWIAKSIDNGKIFHDVNLSDGEWADYCDKNNQPVGIYEIQHKFERIK